MNYDEVNAIVPEAAARTVHCFSVKWLYGSLYRKFNIITDIVACMLRRVKRINGSVQSDDYYTMNRVNTVNYNRKVCFTLVWF